MRQLHFDLLRLLADDRQGSHGSRRARRYVLAQAAETLAPARLPGSAGEGAEGPARRSAGGGVGAGRVSPTVQSRIAWRTFAGWANKIGKPGIVRRDNASYGVGARYAA